MMRILPLIFLTLQALALEMVLVNEEKGRKEFVAGDFLQARLEISPQSEIKDSNKFFKFLEEKELGQFSIISYQEPRISIQNPETIVLDLSIVLRDEAKNEHDLFHTYGGERIPIKLQGFSYRFVGFNPKISILDLDLSEKSYLLLWSIAIVLAIALAIGAVVFIKRYQKNKRKRIKCQQIAKIKQMLEHARDRSEWELLYRQRELWGPYVQKERREYFCTVLNRHQYKEDWSPEEFDEVSCAAKELEVVIYG